MDDKLQKWWSGLELEEQVVALEFDDALVVVKVLLPVELDLDGGVEQVVADVFVLDVELDLVDGGDLELREDAFLGHLVLLLDLDQVGGAGLGGLHGVGDFLHFAGGLRPGGCVLARGLNFLEADVEVLLDEGVEPVFDFVFGPAGQVFADLRPLAAYFAVELEDLVVLVLAPVLLLDARVQLVDEALPDLLPVLGAQHFGEELPVLAVLLDKFPDGLVFLRGPDLVVLAQLRQPPVPVEALVLVPVVHEGGDFCPFFGELLVELQQLVVLFVGPRLHPPFGHLVVFLLHLHVDRPPVLRDNRDDKLTLHFLLQSRLILISNQKTLPNLRPKATFKNKLTLFLSRDCWNCEEDNTYCEDAEKNNCKSKIKQKVSRRMMNMFE